MSLGLGLLYVVVGAGLLWIARLCRVDRLPRNHVVGMRTRATLAGDDAWYAAHRASAWSMAVAGAVTLASGLVLVVVRPDDAVTAGLVLVAAVVVVGVVVAGGVQADRVARQVG